MELCDQINVTLAVFKRINVNGMIKKLEQMIYVKHEGRYKYTGSSERTPVWRASNSMNLDLNDHSFSKDEDGTPRNKPAKNVGSIDELPDEAQGQNSSRTDVYLEYSEDNFMEKSIERFSSESDIEVPKTKPSRFQK
jgi:hypothetical protein